MSRIAAGRGLKTRVLNRTADRHALTARHTFRTNILNRTAVGNDFGVGWRRRRPADNAVLVSVHKAADGPIAHRVAELADAFAKGACDFGQAFGAEHEQGDRGEEEQVDWVLYAHEI